MRILSLAFAAVLAIASVEPLTVAHARLPVALGSKSQDIPTLAPLLKKVTPAVVSIATRGHVAQQQSITAMDPFLRELFGMSDIPAERQIYGAGSGVVIDAGRGYVVTDSHVLQDADEIVVVLPDGRRLTAMLVGADPETDIAVLKIPALDVTAVPLGDSDLLEVGDFVLAIGNPFRIGQTVTSGIVSAVRRHGLGIQGYEDFIQTDASINPGNSGGALINLRGELIGINAAIVGKGGNIGIGFAIPVNMVRNISDQLIKYGSASHGQLGITVEEFRPEPNPSLSEPRLTGVRVAKIEAGSSGERAGLGIRDIITAANSVPVRDPSDFHNKIGMLRVGEAVELTLLRDGRPLTLRATLSVPVKKTLQGSEISQLLAGATFSNSVTTVFGLGVEVTSVRDGSAAAKAGLKKGDIIRFLNDENVVGIDEFADKVKESPSALFLDIMRDGVAKALLITEKRRP